MCSNWKTIVCMVIAAYLRLSYFLRLANLDCRCSSVSLSLLALHCSLCRLNLSFLSVTLSILTWQCNEQYLEKSSILCCKSSMAWLTAQSSLVSPTHYNNVFKGNSLFSVVCGEPNIFWGILEKHHFCPLFIMHSSLYRFLASVGLAQARPIIPYSLKFSWIKILCFVKFS